MLLTIKEIKKLIVIFTMKCFHLLFITNWNKPCTKWLNRSEQHVSL